MWFPYLAERWGILPENMAGLSPTDLEKLTDVIEQDAAEAAKAKRKSNRRTRARGGRR